MKSFDAPQADRLDLVRRVVEAVDRRACDSASIAAQARIAPRYALYALHAARLLELLAGEAGALQITAAGTQLLQTSRGSAGERTAFRAAFAASRAIGAIAPFVLATDAPTATSLAERLVDSGQLSISTALRRASTLLAWRRYLVDEGDRQLRFAALDWNGEDGDVPAAPASVSPRSPEPASANHEGDDTSQGSLREASVAETPGDVGDASQPYLESGSALPDTIVPPAALEGQPAIDVAAAQETIAEATSNTPSVSEHDLAYLRRQIGLGTAILFTGAGFSLSASDATGRRLPTGDAFARELWSLCYPQDEFDSSSLQDIFEHAQRRHGKALRDILQLRFVVDSTSLPTWYGRWFSFPWSKVYTLNVDDLATAMERKYSLPRPMRPVSALQSTKGTGGAGLDVIHLNGAATAGPEGVTFSVDQYAQRLARQEPFYAQLAAELLTRPFVFVGSPLEEPLLWQHISMRGQRTSESENELRPRGFLVTPTLNRARADKLRAYNIVWIRATAEEFAEHVLAGLQDASERGHQTLQHNSSVDSGDERNIVDVSTAIVETARRTAFLLGEEPSWQDIRSGLAVERDEDASRFARLRAAAANTPSATRTAPIIAIAATAGAGKTTLLMKVGAQLHADGRRVAWIGANAEVAPAALLRFYRVPDRPPILVIDDAGRYGTQLVPLLKDLVKSDAMKLIVVALRSYHHALIEAPASVGLQIAHERIGPLTDNDIDRLLGVLERERRLGELRGMNIQQRRSAFRERADRQILVAMIEATSGERFEDKVVSEWQSQEPVAQYVYALTALATAQGYPLSREEILLACSGGTREMDALKRLQRAYLLAEDESGRYRVRHRVIAEKLVDELTERGTHLENLVVGLCRALAIQTGRDEPRNSRRRRTLKRLLNHNTLPRLLDDVESARSAYGQLEAHLEGDYHFWLQRGCLELEDGDIRHAQNFLEQAASINASDPLVETAMAHMRLRTAIANPAGPDAEKLAEDAFAVLRRLITARGGIDPYPAHVFGSQSLAWCRRATLTPRAKTALAREAKDIVTKAVAVHRTRQELRQLLEDITRAELLPH